MKVIVTQHGARRRYLVPRLLHEQGLLEALYTDSCSQTLCGRLAARLGRFSPPRFKRLAARRIEGIPPSMIWATDRVLYSDIKAAMLRRRERSCDAAVRRHEVMSKVMKYWGILEADAVYAMQDEANGFLRYAREEGLKAVVDICVTPLAHRITLDEQKRFSGWETTISDSELEVLETGMRENLTIADLVLCPSRVVADAVMQFAGIPRSRLAVVPYGSSISPGTNNPVPGRILYVGSACLRKGIHYLADAANRLCARYPGEYEFRIAGDAADRIREREECRNLNFLGKLSKAELMEEFSHTDAFVLPTLAEGMPAAVLEAMSYGLPVITTVAAGVEIEHGVDGLLVPERDAQTLATTVQSIVADRALRGRVSKGAQRLASTFMAHSVGVELARALQSMEVPAERKTHIGTHG